MRYRPSPEEVTERAARIRVLLLDVDGVLTDGGILLHPDGEESKVFNVRDGLGMMFARRVGLIVGALSGRSSAANSRRAEELKLDFLYQGESDKKVMVTKPATKAGSKTRAKPAAKKPAAKKGARKR